MSHALTVKQMKRCYNLNYLPYGTFLYLFFFLLKRYFNFSPNILWLKVFT